MNENVQRLIRLQEIAFEIREITARREAGPRRIAELEEEFRRRLEEIGAARLRHESLEEETRRLKALKLELEQRLERSHTQLMGVSNQREYGAVLKEIDATKEALAQTERTIREHEQEIAELAGPASEADERIAAARAELDRSKADIESELSSLADRLSALEGEQARVRAEVEASYLGLYDRLAAARGGVALAAIEHDACGACQMRVRPQLIHLARRGDRIVQCESCKRLLYVAPEAPSTPESDPAAGESADSEAPPAAGADPPPPGAEARSSAVP